MLISKMRALLEVYCQLWRESQLGEFVVVALIGLRKSYLPSFRAVSLTCWHLLFNDDLALLTDCLAVRLTVIPPLLVSLHNQLP